LKHPRVLLTKKPGASEHIFVIVRNC